MSIEAIAMKMNLGDPEAMVAPSVTVALVRRPLSELREIDDENEVEGSDDNNEVQESDDGNMVQGSLGGELNNISPEDMKLHFAVQLQQFNEVLRRATVKPTSEEPTKLIDKLSGMFPGVIKRATDDDIAAGALSRDTSSTYGHMLIILSTPKGLSLSLVSLILHPSCQLITGSNTWLREGYIQHMEVDSRTKFKDRFSSMCSALLNYLNEKVPEMVPGSRLNNGLVTTNQEAFSLIVHDLHAVACWGLSLVQNLLL